MIQYNADEAEAKKKASRQKDEKEESNIEMVIGEDGSETPQLKAVSVSLRVCVYVYMWCVCVRCIHSCLIFVIMIY